MPISDFTAYPARGSATFSEDGDAFVAHMPVFIDEVNDAVAAMNADEAAAAASASAASASASAASASASAAQAALAAVSGAIGMNTVAVTGTSQTAVTANLYVLQNAGATTVTLPATPANGDVVGVLVANGRIDNVIARNGKQINGLAENLTIDVATASVLLRYVDATSQWRLV